MADTATMSAALHDKRFPDESADYREARTELLQAEIELRRQVERVAAMRRRLPPGGEVPQDYVFEGEEGPVRLSELFGPHETLVAYSYMYGPKMERPCPMCTAMLDGLEGQAVHIGQRASLVVIARSPYPRIRAFADERGWRRLRLLSSADNSYHRDYHGETDDGSQLPILNVFSRRGGRIRHTWASEMMFTPPDPGENQRHIDMIWPVWNVLDLTPEGRGEKTYTKLEYE
jgi:predicted dithiol-disulfide oxidoreductase (DUF899 family)